MAWRYALAFALTMAFLIVWLRFVAPPVPPRPPQGPPAVVPAAGQTPAPGAQVVPPVPGAPAPASQAQSLRPSYPPREERAEAGPHLGLVASSRSGSISGILLPEFREKVGDVDPYVLVHPQATGPAVFSLEIDDNENAAKPSRIPLDEHWQLERPGGPEASAVLFTQRDEVDGVVITKSVLPGGPEHADPRPPGGVRHVRLRLELHNKEATERKLTYRLYGPVGLDSENHQSAGADLELVYAAADRGGTVHVETLPAAKVEHRDLGDPSVGRRIAWVGASNYYFTCVLFPLGKDGAPVDFLDKGFADSYPDRQSLEELARAEHHRPLAELDPQTAAGLAAKAYKNVKAGLRSILVTIPPGQTVVHEYGLYAGPRDRDSLAPYATLSLNEVNRYGMFSVIVSFFIWLLSLLKTVTFGSWGLAIALLTLLVKLCLHPINKRSQAGMHRFQKKMQAVKPEMDALKERYAQKPAQMQKEMQALFKKHGINPGQQMAGCLMIFLQMPIWIGLYTTLQYAIGLRQAGFLYIQDLTRADQLFSFGFSLPFLGEYFNLLPILYVILTIVNQRMQPKPEDPQMLAQYRMMTFMLVFFGFIFYKFPAGFMLYIMTSAALGIIESKIIKAELAHEEAKAAAAGSLAPVTVLPGGPRKKGKPRP